MHWDIAPENAGAARCGGGDVRLDEPRACEIRRRFWRRCERAVERGLKADSALKALTTTPAALLGMSERLGKIAPGMAGNLVVTDGDLFGKRTKVVETGSMAGGSSSTSRR